MTTSKPVCLVLGAGAGIGGHVAKRFASGGYHAVLARRTDEAGLTRLINDIHAAGGSANGHIINAVDDGAIEALIDDTEAACGPIDTVIFNLGAQIGNRSLQQTSLKAFEMGWRMTTLALFRVAKHLLPRMVERGGGNLLVTSATSAMRGNAGQHSHAAAIGGRRMLCQSLNAEFAPQNIHVCHIVVDAAVEAPDTLGKLLGPERYAALLAERANGKDGMVIPEHLAETYFQVAQQHRSAWTFEMDVRPYSDQAWWNT